MYNKVVTITDNSSTDVSMAIGVRRIRSTNEESPFTVPPKPVSILPAGEEFQIMDTGQGERFQQFMKMMEKHHQEKMEVLEQIIACLVKKEKSSAS